MESPPTEKIRLLFQLRRYPEAEAAARELIGHHPESSEGYFYLAHVLLCLGRVKEAAEASQVVLAKMPHASSTHSLHSKVLLEVGHTFEAISAGYEAVRLDPTDPDAYMALADALLQADRLAECRAVITSARSQFPNHATVLYQAGLLALASDRLEELAGVVRAGQALDPTDPRFHLLGGLAATKEAEKQYIKGPERRQLYQQAERLLGEAVRLWPTHVIYRALRKHNASESRQEAMTRFVTVWAWGMLFGGYLLPRVIIGRVLPLWYWGPPTVLVWFVGIFLVVRCPEFNLVLPSRRKNAVTIPLMPEERRKGIRMWVVFIALTVTTLFLPMQFFRR